MRSDNLTLMEFSHILAKSPLSICSAKLMCRHCTYVYAPNLLTLSILIKLMIEIL